MTCFSGIINVPSLTNDKRVIWNNYGLLCSTNKKVATNVGGSIVLWEHTIIAALYKDMISQQNYIRIHNHSNHSYPSAIVITFFKMKVGSSVWLCCAVTLIVFLGTEALELPDGE